MHEEGVDGDPEVPPGRVDHSAAPGNHAPGSERKKA